MVLLSVVAQQILPQNFQVRQCFPDLVGNGCWHGIIYNRISQMLVLFLLLYRHDELLEGAETLFQLLSPMLPHGI